jgi:CheY-like chemotaxis protein
MSPTVNARTYLPGDFVHVIVEAPLDTAQITAIMPDATLITLIQQRSSRVWRGIWQVPVDFKKGTYSASLTAVDVQGNVFTGQTDSFNVGELQLISLVGKPTKEAAPTIPLQETIKSTAPAAVVEKAKAEGNEELLNKILKIVTETTAVATAELPPNEKVKLIEKNIADGKDDAANKNWSLAAAHFRIVLYLDPKNRDAGKYLVEAEQHVTQEKKIATEKAKQQLIIVIGLVIVVGLILAGILYLIIRYLPKNAPLATAERQKSLSEKEKQKQWCGRSGWTDNPFSPDILKQMFIGNAKLERDGFKLFISTQIKRVGGQGFEPFTESALDSIYALSKGKPIEAIKICDWAVNQAIFLNEEKISAELIKGYERVGLKKILIADDEEIIRESISAILKKGGGYETDFASDGEEVLRKIKENVYGLVLLDIEMPKIDGYEILKQARLLYPDLPIIFVTGKGTPQKTMESISQYNLTAYIEKPFTPAKILDTVARTLKIR